MTRIYSLYIGRYSLVTYIPTRYKVSTDEAQLNVDRGYFSSSGDPPYDESSYRRGIVITCALFHYSYLHVNALVMCEEAISRFPLVM